MLTTIQNLGELRNFFDGRRGVLAVDTETTGKKPQLGDRACGYSFAWRDAQEVKSCYVPTRHKPEDTGASLFEFDKTKLVNLPAEEVNAIVKPILEDTSIVKVLHHAKFDIQVFWAEGIDLRNFHCTMVMSNLIEPRRPNGLKKLMQIVLGEIHTEQQDVFRYMTYHRLSKNSGYEKLPIEIAGPYAARDTDATLRLYEKLDQQIGDVADIYAVERRIIKVIAAMERRGMPADRTFLADMAGRLARSAENVARRAHELAGWQFDPGKSGQVAKLLYGQLRIPIPRLGPGKTPTDKAALEKIEHPIARLISIWRYITKLRNTYFGPMSEMVSETNRIHASFQQVKMLREEMGGKEGSNTGTDTGRLSCTSPNLQNVGARRKVYKNGKFETVPQTLVRRGFRIFEPGWDFLLFDYSQMELRFLAHDSGDPTLVKAYSKVEFDDIHEITASRIFPEDWVKAQKMLEAGKATRNKALEEDGKKKLKMMRSIAKTLNFGIVYGMGAERLAAELDFTQKMGERRGVEEARRFLEIYFETYPGVKDLDERLKWDFKRTGYVETAYGRRRPMLQQDEYKALNTRIQGSCADMNKIALYQVDAALRKPRLKTCPINNIHDEITLLHWEEEPEQEVIAITKRAMEDFPGVRVPIVVEAARAFPTWAHKKEITDAPVTKPASSASKMAAST